MPDLVALVADHSNPYASALWRYCNGEWARVQFPSGVWVRVADGDVPAWVVQRIRDLGEATPEGSTVN